MQVTKLSINENKTENGTGASVLGVALSNTVDRQGSAALTQLVTEKRRKRIVSKCLKLMHHKGPIRGSILKSILGASDLYFTSQFYQQTLSKGRVRIGECSARQQMACYGDYLNRLQARLCLVKEVDVKIRILWDAFRQVGSIW